MIDRKKVIKGLMICVNRIPGEYDCNKCPYEIDGNNCEINMGKDALALLKEQKDIVQCKDCKRYDEKISMCDNCGLPREQTFFCADGKRRIDNA